MSSADAQQHREPAADERLIVDDGDADHAGAPIRQPHRDAEAAASARAGLERTAVHADSLAHADQPVAAVGRHVR